mmetsp:Transcript_109525/g.251145  ORF Transcript_109525/g.251145 Transcript_109525/m.251145 type:complete len:286 (+) Transcript_109525:203-1060(+)
MTIPAVHASFSQRSLRRFCFWWVGWYRTFRYISVLQELHIATVILCEAMRWRRPLAFMHCCFYVVWAGGFAMGLADGLGLPWHPDEAALCAPRIPDFLTIGVISGCALICAGVYAVVVWQSRKRMPGSVQRHTLRFAGLYPVNFCLTYFASLAANADLDLMENHVFWVVAISLEFSSGFLNAVFYALSSRYGVELARGSSMGRGQSGLVDGSSFHAAFGEPEVVEVESLWEAAITDEPKRHRSLSQDSNQHFRGQHDAYQGSSLVGMRTAPGRGLQSFGGLMVSR